MQGSLSDSDWKLLLHRIKEGRCTPFLGAGASFPALPLGGGLAERWSSEHSYPLADRTDLPRVAQYLAVTYDSMFPKEELANSFKKCAPPDFSARDEPHSVLSKLPLPIYMTTNYDDFMIRALKAQGREGVRETCRWKSDIKHLPSEFEKGYVPSAQQPVVFHLHGYLDETKSMVLTEDDHAALHRSAHPAATHPGGVHRFDAAVPRLRAGGLELSRAVPRACRVPGQEQHPFARLGSALASPAGYD